MKLAGQMHRRGPKNRLPAATGRCAALEPVGRLFHTLAPSVSIASAAIPLMLPMPASAHRTWNNGLPVPEWVARSCCGPSDAHRLNPDQVHRVAGGYLIDGYPKTILDAQVLPSEDGEYWAFYSEFVDADGAKGFTDVYCFFVPAAG